MEHYGLTQSLEQAGYYETAHYKQLMKDIKGAIREGRLIAKWQNGHPATPAAATDG